MKTILLLGGGNCQRSAARYAAEQGIRVILADYTAHPPAAQYAAHHLPISSFDVEACTRAAREYQVDGVMTVGTDQPVYTAACVSQTLGLPFPISVETALCVTNKQVMKTCMTKAGIPTVPYCFLGRTSRPADVAHLGSPLVIKPLDSQGQRGIFKLNTAEEIIQHIPESLSFSRCDQVLAERFYESDEVTISGWVQDGRLYVLTITDRLHCPDAVHIGVCSGHRCPSIHMDQAAEMTQICEDLCRACGIRNGPLYVQVLVGREGILVNELACRIGGAFEDFFIPYVTGFNILDAVLHSSLGLPVDCSMLEHYDVTKASRHAAVQLLFCHSVTVAACTPEEELNRLPYVLDAGFNYHVGDTVPSMENATARFGHAVLTAESRTEMQACIRSFYDRFHVTDAHGADMVNRLYPPI